MPPRRQGRRNTRPGAAAAAASSASNEERNASHEHQYDPNVDSGSEEELVRNNYRNNEGEDDDNDDGEDGSNLVPYVVHKRILTHPSYRTQRTPFRLPQCIPLPATAIRPYAQQLASQPSSSSHFWRTWEKIAWEIYPPDQLAASQYAIDHREQPQGKWTWGVHCLKYLPPRPIVEGQRGSASTSEDTPTVIDGVNSRVWNHLSRADLIARVQRLWWLIRQVPYEAHRYFAPDVPSVVHEKLIGIENEVSLNDVACVSSSTLLFSKRDDEQGHSRRLTPLEQWRWDVRTANYHRTLSANAGRTATQPTHTPSRSQRRSVEIRADLEERISPETGYSEDPTPVPMYPANVPLSPSTTDTQAGEEALSTSSTTLRRRGRGRPPRPRVYPSSHRGARDQGQHDEEHEEYTIHDDDDNDDDDDDDNSTNDDSNDNGNANATGTRQRRDQRRRNSRGSSSSSQRRPSKSKSKTKK
jgi:hypothetical protein